MADCRFERPIGDADGGVARMALRRATKSLFDRNARAARLANEHVDRAVNLQLLRIDAGGDLDRRVPGDLAFVLFDFEAGSYTGPYRRALSGRAASGMARAGDSRSSA